MPNRIVREGINDSERVDLLSWQAEALYRRLINVVDDFGRYEWKPALVVARAFPLRTDMSHRFKVTTQDIHVWMMECVEAGLVEIYQVSGRDYLMLADFKQRTRTDSKFPGPRAAVTPLSVNCQTDVSQVHARASDTNTASATPPNTNPPAAVKPSSKAAFDVFWNRWSSVRGTNHKPQAFQAWLSYINEPDEGPVMACADSYLRGPGSNPHSGYNPDGFIADQSRDQFSARWPSRAPPQNDRKARASADFDARILEDISLKEVKLNG